MELLSGIRNGIRDVADVFTGIHTANKQNKEIADQNLQFQQEQAEFNKWLQMSEWAREDNSYQRTIADMRKAGLSPLTMNGTNDSGELLATEANHNDYQAQAEGGIATLLGMVNGIQQIQANMLQNKKTIAETNALDEQTSFAKESKFYKLKTLGLEVLNKGYESLSKDQRQKIANAYGLPADASDETILKSMTKELYGIDTGKIENTTDNPLTTEWKWTGPKAGINPMKKLIDALPDGKYKDSLSGVLQMILQYIAL